MFGKNKNSSPQVVGFYQALGALLYVGVVSILIRYLGNFGPDKPGFLGMMLMLFLLVFSAAMCGIIVFGYPAYLGMHNRVKEALSVLGYTFMYSLFIIIILVFVILI